jgi:cytochrome c oxidase subunit III
VSLLRQLFEKPWYADRRRAAELPEESAFPLPAPTLGLRLILAVVTVLFSLLVVAYGDRMSVSDWRPLPEPALLWLNTLILAFSSLAWHWACINARRGDLDGVKTGLLAGGGSAFAFLLGQYWAWQQMIALGYYAASNPANSFFYLVTAAHGLHLLGGLVAWGRTTTKVWSGEDVAKVRLSVELCAIYWHFLLVVWLILFALLLFT